MRGECCVQCRPGVQTQEEAIDFRCRCEVTDLGALGVAKRYESGTVTINCTSHYQAVDMAFGGVKGSGDGREYTVWPLGAGFVAGVSSCSLGPLTSHPSPLRPDLPLSAILPSCHPPFRILCHFRSCSIIDNR